MGGNGHRVTNFAIALHPSAEPRHPALGAALEAARPALVRLYAGFERRRQVQIAEFVAAFVSTNGRIPTAPDVAVALGPPISTAAATCYLAQNQKRDKDDGSCYDMPASPQPRGEGTRASRYRTQVAGAVPVAQYG